MVPYHTTLSQVPETAAEINIDCRHAVSLFHPTGPSHGVGFLTIQDVVHCVVVKVTAVYL